MAQYCDRCRQPFADGLSSCPRCQARTAANGTASSHPGHALDSTPLPSLLRSAAPTAAQPAPSDAQIDLGKPAMNAAPGNDGPPSGASFASWSALVPKRKAEAEKEPGPARQGARVMVNQAGDAGNTPRKDAPADDAEIDLGGPVGQARDKDDPPSGASFVSWSDLLKKRRDLENEAPPPPPGPQPPQTVGSARSMLEGPRPAPAPAPAPVPRPGWVGGVVFGIALALALCLALWLIGYK